MHAHRLAAPLSHLRVLTDRGCRASLPQATLLVMLLENTISACECWCHWITFSTVLCCVWLLGGTALPRVDQPRIGGCQPGTHLCPAPMPLAAPCSRQPAAPSPPPAAADDMQVWGWRIPFLLAFSTALLGYFMRRGMPEPKAFLAAARAEKEEEAASAAADGESPKVDGSEEGEAAGNGSVKR